MMLVRFKEPVPLSQSTLTLILRGVAFGLFLIFGLYMYIVHDADLLHGGIGLFLTGFGVVIFAAHFFAIRFYVVRSTRVISPNTDV